MYQSVATIDSPEFLNLQPLDINPLMSKCEIKVLYIGANRNKTFINEQVAMEIGKTLRGAPIVGYYKDNKEDFSDHGEKVIIDDEGVHFSCQTVPYGFVAPDAKVWFQNFEDTNGLGEKVIHKYLMTTGYLWTGQFAESSLPVDEGRPQSMQLLDSSITGHWEQNSQGMDFFIINDAIIQKICILGEDVEPCFEGASITAPDISTKFTLDDNYKHTLYSMMQDLKNALDRGGQQMENLENTVAIEEEDVNVNFTKNQDKINETDSSENDNILEDTSISSDYEKKEDEDEKEDASDSETDTEQNEEEVEDEDDEDDEKDNAKKYTVLEEEFQSLLEKYNDLNAQCQKLMQFKKQVDNQKKDALIAEFYMLSDEDKKDVIQNKENYTLEDIKAKLSVICFDKKINFTLNEKETDEVKDSNIITYNLDNENSNLPEWVKAVKEQEKLS